MFAAHLIQLTRNAVQLALKADFFKPGLLQRLFGFPGSRLQIAHLLPAFRDPAFQFLDFLLAKGQQDRLIGRGHRAAAELRGALGAVPIVHERRLLKRQFGV